MDIASSSKQFQDVYRRVTVINTVQTIVYFYKRSKIGLYKLIMILPIIFKNNITVI